MFGSEGATAMSPIEAVVYTSNTGSNVVPLFTVLKIPPVAYPT